MPELGRAALVVCFGLALYAVVAGFWGASTRRRRLAVSAQNALVAAFVAAAVSTGVLLVALATSDFSFTYVSDRTSNDLPLAYKLTALWGGQEGSLLLWLLVLTGYGAAAVLLDRKAGRELVTWVVPILGVVAAFFSMLVVFVASPFRTHLAPADGLGLNSSLQSPYMQAHPPLLYLGYVGLTVPFAFAMGALLSRRTDERWIVATRRWTLAAWMFLGDRPAARRQVGVRGSRLGRLLRVGSGRERGADALARVHGIPALGDGAGEEGDAEGLEHAARHAGIHALAVRHLPDPLGGAQLDPLVHRELDRSVVPGLHLLRRRRLGRAAPQPAAAAQVEDEARVARLARGDVPLQQPAPRRALPDHPLGCHLPDPLRGRARSSRSPSGVRTTTSSCARSGCRCCC